MAFKTVSSQNNTDEWLTPPSLVRCLGSFDLDPCASRFQKVMLAKTNYSLPEQNGLLLPWHGRVWCNPPFYDIRRWVERFFLHDNGILLVPAWPGNTWFQSIWRHSPTIFFSRRGIQFHKADTFPTDGKNGGRSMFGIALCAAGPDNALALRNIRFCLHGALVTKPELL